MTPFKKVKASKLRPIKRTKDSVLATADTLEPFSSKARQLITGRLQSMLKSGLAERIAGVIGDASLGKVQLKPHQLQIIEMILDRTEGKPQQVRILDANQVDEHTARLLAELLQRRLAAEEQEN